MSKYFLSLCLSILTSAAALAADLADALQSGTLWTLPQTELVDKYLNGVMYRNVDSGTMRLKAAGALTIGELSPNEIDWIWDEKKEHPASLLIVLYNKGDDGNIDKKEFNQRVKDALAALDAVCGVKGKKKNVAAKESGVKLKAWIWEWENGAAMLEAHDTGKGKKDYEAEFIRLRMAKDAAGLERGSASDAGSRRELLANVKRTEEGDVWIDNIPMIDQGEKGYCLPATVARIFSYYGMDGVDMHAMASMCDTVAGGGTTIGGMMEALEKIGSRFHVRVMTMKDKGKKPGPEEIVESYNKLAKRKGKPASRGFIGVADRDIDNALSIFDQEILEESFPVKKAAMKKWFRPVYKSIDSGIPILWGIPGHMRLIIGYNEAKGLIYYSDSWGAGHEKKKMSALNAYMITLYRGYLRLSK
ncbi:MAG: hypothetical protein E7034_02975 [Akkermansiaceae bacterium]|nr:hypothetical protein [Akkermansiaceae bacterium]